MNTKECPLRPRAPCTKEKCAWYLVHSKQCAIPLIASELKKRYELEQKWFKD